LSSDSSTDAKIQASLRQATQPVLSDSMRQMYLREAAGFALSKGMWLRPFAVNVDALPQDVDLTAPKMLAKVFLGLALFFLVMTGIPLLILTQEPEMPWWGFALVAAMPLICLIVIVACIRAIRQRRTATFNSDHVEVNTRGLGVGAAQWRETYGTFRGVGVSEQIIDTRYDKKTFQIVQLLHDEPEKSVPLMIAEGDAPLIEECHAYANRLGLRVVSSG
jgi:hypothetical protein